MVGKKIFISTLALVFIAGCAKFDKRSLSGLTVEEVNVRPSIAAYLMNKCPVSAESEALAALVD